jgi:NCAIR mutase (PurE)-related protein
MNPHEALSLARELLSGDLSPEDFAGKLARPSTADLGDTRLDLDRQNRCGFPEVIFGEGKTPETIHAICARLLDSGFPVLATRIAPDVGEGLQRAFPAGEYHPIARTFCVPAPGENSREADTRPRGIVTVVSAGTSDRPVAEEARQTALWSGAEVRFVQDVGVAGPHRLREQLDKLQDADAVVVVAGMEGALPSVVGGHVGCPVIAVPTSVGYGASFGGIAALLGMLNSCASNVTVVNIDAGFKGGYVAGLIAKNAAQARHAS